MIFDDESGPALKILPDPQHDTSSSAPNKTNAWIQDDLLQPQVQWHVQLDPTQF